MKSVIKIAVVMMVVMMASVSSYAVEIRAQLGETLELKVSDFVSFEPKEVYWLAYTGPQGWSDVSDRNADITYLQIVNEIEPGSLLDYYNVLLKVWDNNNLVKSIIIQIYLDGPIELSPVRETVTVVEETPVEEPVVEEIAVAVEEPVVEETPVIETEEPEEFKNDSEIRKFQYVRDLKKSETKIDVRMYADVIMPDLSGPLSVTITVTDQNGNTFVMSDDFQTNRKMSGKKKTTVKSVEGKSRGACYYDF